ncbi:MAG: TRAP-type C4-dicarboxylate transport system permease small subunit [Paracoccaceae bacterium]|jgi:TRAP-type C4-dicarboxylate transport system permease small subunit
MLRALDLLYKAAGAIAALSILGISLLVTAQVSLNILARIGGPELSYTIPSYADFAGYFLATATFMALAYTLRAGGHIRVNLVVQVMPPRARWVFEVLALSLGTAVAGCATWFSVGLIRESIAFGDMSYGIVAIPLWMPQTSMVTGLGLLTVALLHTLAEALIAGQPILKDAGSE